MKNQKNVAIKKGCHSRKLVSGIYNARRCQRKENALLNRCVEDPRLQTSGMTPSFTTTRGFIARSVIPQCWYAGYSGRNGFTLIELLVVVLIIGILAAVAVPQYQKTVQKSRIVQVLLAIHTTRQAIDSYLLANGYPQQQKTFTSNDAELDISVKAVLTGQVVGNLQYSGHAYCTPSACETGYYITKWDADDESYSDYVVLFARKETNSPAWKYYCAYNDTSAALQDCKAWAPANYTIIDWEEYVDL